MQQGTTKRAVRPSKAAEKLGVSTPTLWRYARTVADFPRPTKLSPQVTVFDEDELDAWVASRRGKTAPPGSTRSNVQIRDAAAALGCRLVSDLSAEELSAWTTAGRPGRVVLSTFELATLKALERLRAHSNPAGG